jgi:D-aspartate ligase
MRWYDLCSARLEKKGLKTDVPVVVLAPGYHGHGIARSLGRLGVPVYGVHADPRSPAARSRYWRTNVIWNLAEACADESVTWLLRLGRRIGSRPILIPTDDSSCLFVADHAAALRETFVFPQQPAGLARALSSKKLMYLLCKEHNIPTPETVFPRSRDDILAFLADATFPVLLKGIDTLALRRQSGRRMVVVNDARTLLHWYDALETPHAPNLMVQDYIPGGSEAVWMFDGYFDDAARCLFGLTGKKIRQYPAYTGVTSLGMCLANDVVAQQTIGFMQALGYRGILDLGYKYDARSGQYKLLDVNPRVGTTFRLFVDSAGMDVVRALYRDLTGQPVVRGAPCEGRKWVVENFDLVSSLTYCRDGKVGAREWIGSYRGVQEVSWFARDDLLPFVTVGWRSLLWPLEQQFSRSATRGAGTRP